MDQRDFSGLMQDVNTLLGGGIINPALHASIRRVVSRILEGQLGGVDGYIAFNYVPGTYRWALSISGFGTRTQAQGAKRAVQKLHLPLISELQLHKEKRGVDADAYSILMMLGIDTPEE
jgi:hypothetical protein